MPRQQTSGAPSRDAATAEVEGRGTPRRCRRSATGGGGKGVSKFRAVGVGGAIDDLLATSTSSETGLDGRRRRSSFLYEEEGFRRSSAPAAVPANVDDDGSDNSPRTRQQREALRTRGEWNPTSSMIPAHFPAASSPSSVVGGGEPIVFDPFREDIHSEDDERDLRLIKRPSVKDGFARGASFDPERGGEYVELDAFVTAGDVRPPSFLPPAASPLEAQEPLTPGHAARLGLRGGGRPPLPLPPSKSDTGSLLAGRGSSDGRRRSSASEASSLSAARSERSRLSGVLGAGWQLRRLSPAPENTVATEPAKVPSGKSPAANRRGRVCGIWRLPGGSLPSSSHAGRSGTVTAPEAIAARRASQHRQSGLTQNEDDEDDNDEYELSSANDRGLGRGFDPLADTSGTGGTRLTSLSSAYVDIRRDRGVAGTPSKKGESDDIDGDQTYDYRGKEERYESILCREVLNTRPRQIAFVSVWAAILIGIILLSALLTKDDQGGSATSANLGNGTASTSGNWSAETHGSAMIDMGAGPVEGQDYDAMGADVGGSWEDAAYEDDSNDEKKGETAAPLGTESADAMANVAISLTAHPFELESESDEDRHSEAPRDKNIFSRGGSRRGLRLRRRTASETAAEIPWLQLKMSTGRGALRGS